MTIGRIDSSPSSVDLLSLDQSLNAQIAGDPGAQIAVMLVKSARDSRDLAHAAAEDAEERLSRLEDEQVQNLYAQAAATRAAGESRAIGQMMVAGATFGGLALGDPSAAGMLKSGAEFGQGMLNFDAVAQDFQAGIHGADATQAANRIQGVQRELQDLSDEKRDASQLVRTAIESASELSRTQTATDQATLFLRG